MEEVIKNTTMKILLSFLATFLVYSGLSQGLTEMHETDHYKIRYPEKWTLLEDDDLGEAIHIVAPKSGNADQFTENVSVVVQDLTGIDISIDDFVRLAEQQILETVQESEVLSSKRFEAGKIKSHKLIYKGVIKGFPLKLIRYYQLNNNKAYILTYTALEKDFEQHKLYGQQILNSFRFKT